MNSLTTDVNTNYTPPVPLSIPSLDVAGRVFFITGGTQSLGLEIAQQLKRYMCSCSFAFSRWSVDADEATVKEDDADRSFLLSGRLAGEPERQYVLGEELLRHF
eukprot:scaffold2716_cov202-Alexandrium_tamarense.AAC.18